MLSPIIDLNMFFFLYSLVYNDIVYKIFAIMQSLIMVKYMAEMSAHLWRSIQQTKLTWWEVKNHLRK